MDAEVIRAQLGFTTWQRNVTGNAPTSVGGAGIRELLGTLKQCADAHVNLESNHRRLTRQLLPNKGQPAEEPLDGLGPE